MAIHIIQKLVDDLDGTEASETVKFGLDGDLREIDLSAKNAAKLRDVLKPFLDVSRPTTNGRRLQSAATVITTPNGRAVKTTSDEDRARMKQRNKEIRAWAAEHGYTVAPQGVIKKEIVDAYDEYLRRQAEVRKIEVKEEDRRIAEENRAKVAESKAAKATAPPVEAVDDAKARSQARAAAKGSGRKGAPVTNGKVPAQGGSRTTAVKFAAAS